MPVDHVAAQQPSAYVGRRRAAVPAPAAADTTAPTPTALATAAPDTALDTGTIERVLSELEPADQTTSFEHEPTAQLPMLRAEPTTTTSTHGGGGKRRATRSSARGPLFKGLPSAPVLLGIAALALSVGGAVTVGDPQPASNDPATTVTHAASALGGTGGQGQVLSRGGAAVTRDSSRDAQADAAGAQLKDAAEALAQQRDGALKDLANKTESYAKVIAKDNWGYPLEPVILTARFGQYGLWSSYHTGLDFNGETGDQIHAIANGTVISASYDGSYGNKTVVQLEDGTELWYCHQSAFLVSPGDTITRGEVIGLVGATGHVTGSHLHVEVRPGGGDPVDPYPAMQQHGLFLGSEAQPG